MELGSPFLTFVAALTGGIGLLALSRFARRFTESTASLLRLSFGDISFTELAGMFLIGYAIGAFVTGLPAQETTSGGPPRPIGVGRRFIGFGGSGPGGNLAATTGFVFALITFLYRLDIPGRLAGARSAPPTRAVADIVGTDGTAAEDIPAGGHGQITYRDQLGRLTAVLVASDVAIPRGASVRIVGTKGLNPLVAPALRTEAPQGEATHAVNRPDRGSRVDP